jgi:Fic family protein
MSARIRVDEWLKELERIDRKATVDEKGYRTMREFAEQWGVSRDTAQKRLNDIVQAGFLDDAIYVSRVRLDKRECRVPAYRIRKGKVAK